MSTSRISQPSAGDRCRRTSVDVQGFAVKNTSNENSAASRVRRPRLPDPAGSPTKGEVSVEYLAKSFKVSSATIRRDLTELEQQGFLRRNHGGAVLVAPMLYEAFRHVSSFQEQEEQCVAEKRRIGLMAANLVADGEIIAIGAGTTTTQVARSVRHRKGITVLTRRHKHRNGA